MSKIWLIDNFTGGQADEEKRGIAGAFYYGEQLDFRSNPSVLTGSNAPTKATGAVIGTSIKWISQLGTTVYAYGANGHIYKSGSPWTDAHTNGQTGVGNGMGVMGTKLYYASNAKLGSYDGAATWTDDAFALKTGEAGSWHPMKVFSPAGGLCVGDGRYIGVLDYDGITWNDDALILPLDEKMKCFEVWNDYLVIGTYKGTNVYDDNVGTLYFWNGTDTSYSFKIDMNESGIHALLNSPFGLMIVAGVRGNIYLYNGGNPVLIKRIPSFAKTGTNYNEIYPGAVTNFGGLAMIGACGGGTDATSVKGVYSWGTINKNYPSVFNLDYLISTGTKAGTTCLVTAVEAINDNNLYIAWRDNASYGIDLVNSTNKVASCTYQSLYFDGGSPFIQKTFKRFMLNFDTLAANESITLSYRKDTETAFTTIGAISSTGENFYEFDYAIQARRIQLQVVLSGSNNTLPKLQSIAVPFDTKEI